VAAVILDVTDATFESEVVERSKQVPVVVDLWAPWCGPCKTLGPMLERIVAATGGQVVLAKVNVDDNPQVGAAFRVQSIPAVYAMKDTKVVDGFMGAQPEATVKEFVDRLRPSEQEAELERLVAAGDEASLRRALELDADHEPAILALAELLTHEGKGDEALEVLSKVPETGETRRIAALARRGGEPVDGEDVDTKLGELLGRVKEDENARKEFIDLLELLGPDDPRTATWRKKLTAELF
jgi:putative thioredoxin